LLFRRTLARVLQLPRSSGIGPESLFCIRKRNRSRLPAQRWGGMAPLSWLSVTSSSSSLPFLPRLAGISPVRLFLLGFFRSSRCGSSGLFLYQLNQKELELPSEVGEREHLTIGGAPCLCWFIDEDLRMAATVGVAVDRLRA
jgi:hypothetical protein